MSRSYLARIQVGNSRSQITNLPTDVFRVLRFELSYKVAEEVERKTLDPRDGSVRVTTWDGYQRLMGKDGILPSGLVPRATRLLGKLGVGYELIDSRKRPDDAMPLWRLPEGFELRDYQKAAVEAAERRGRGVVHSSPRTGKTIMMLELARRVACQTVITSPTEAIASQTFDKFNELLSDWCSGGPCPQDFYLLTGGPPKSRKQIQAAKRAKVFMATADTAVAMPESFWDKVQCLIVDERHHQAAKTYHRINDLARNAYWRWGFTGTNYRSDPTQQVALEACLGRTVAEYTIEEMTQRGVLVPGQVRFIPVDYPGMRSARFQDAYRAGVVASEARNKLVARAAIALERQGRKVLVLVHHIDHGMELQSRIPGSRFVQGADGDEVRKAVAALDQGQISCLIGSPVVGEGLDCPSADALVYAKGYKAKVTHTQDTFRVLTGDGGKKKEAIIVDFADRHNRTLLEHSVARMKNYREMGFTIRVEQNLDGEQLVLA